MLLCCITLSSSRENQCSAQEVALAREGGEIKAGQTSRGSGDVIHDNRDQAGASTRSVLVSSLVPRGQAQTRSTEAS